MTGRALNQVRTSDVPPHLVRGILLLHHALGCNTLPMFAWRLRRCMGATLNPRTPLVPFMPPPMRGGMLSLARAVLRKHYPPPSRLDGWNKSMPVPRIGESPREREALDIMVRWERVWTGDTDAVGWLGGFDLMREAREADWREHNERLNRDLQRVRSEQLTRETTRLLAQAVQNYWNLSSDAGQVADAAEMLNRRDVARRAAAPFEPIPLSPRERVEIIREQQRGAVPDDAPVVVAWCQDGRRHHRVIDALADKVTHGAMTINQARAAIGLGPFPDGSLPPGYVDMGMSTPTAWNHRGDLIIMDDQPVGYAEVIEGEIVEGAPLALPSAEE